MHGDADTTVPLDQAGTRPGRRQVLAISMRFVTGRHVQKDVPYVLTRPAYSRGAAGAAGVGTVDAGSGQWPSYGGQLGTARSAEIGRAHV